MKLSQRKNIFLGLCCPNLWGWVEKGQTGKSSNGGSGIADKVYIYKKKRKNTKKRKKPTLSGLKDCPNLSASVAPSALGFRYWFKGAFDSRLVWWWHEIGGFFCSRYRHQRLSFGVVLWGSVWVSAAPIDVIVAGKRDFSAPADAGPRVRRWWLREVGCEGPPASGWVVAFVTGNLNGPLQQPRKRTCDSNQLSCIPADYFWATLSEFSLGSKQPFHCLSDHGSHRLD